MNDEKETPIHIYFIFIFIIITIFLIILRILLNFVDISTWIQKTKDIDFKILLEGMDNGLINFYDPVDISEWPPYYLYFWYFLFFPIYVLPSIVGVYIWDIIRLLLSSYLVYQSARFFKNKKDLLIFYVFATVGYSIDAYYNNVNFIIAFFLFISYYFLENEKKWYAGIFFTLATFKITAIIFLPILLIVRKIKFKDLLYYLIPFVIICIPYILFPEYFLQMIRNWGYSDVEVKGILIIDSIFWKALQPSHLMFIGLLFIIFIENIKDERRKKIYRIILVFLITIYYVYLTIIVFIIPVILN